MKQISSIRLMLGVSQEDIARLLKVTRSQLAMFETGKRDLPSEAKILLAHMLVHATQASLKRQSVSSQPDAKKQEFLKELLQENEFERTRMARRLEKIRNSHQKRQAVLNMTVFLTKYTADKAESYQQLVQSIQAKATYMYGGCDDTTLMNCEIKCELLEREKQLLEEFIAKHTIVKAIKK